MQPIHESHLKVTFRRTYTEKTSGFVVITEAKDLLKETLRHDLTTQEIKVLCDNNPEEATLLPQDTAERLGEILKAEGWEVKFEETPPPYLLPILPELCRGPHRQRMGMALWVYLWLVDEVTRDDDEDGIRWGITRHGDPITYQEIANDLNISRETVRLEIKILRKWGYIRTRLSSQGAIIDIYNSYKWRFKEQRTSKLATAAGKTSQRCQRSLAPGKETPERYQRSLVPGTKDLIPPSPATIDRPKGSEPLTNNNKHKEIGELDESRPDRSSSPFRKTQSLDKCNDNTPGSNAAGGHPPTHSDLLDIHNKDSTPDPTPPAAGTSSRSSGKRRSRSKYSPDDREKLKEIKTYIDRVHQKHWKRPYPWTGAPFGKTDKQLYALIRSPLSLADIKLMIDMLARIMTDNEWWGFRRQTRISSFSVGVLFGYKELLIQEARKYQKEWGDTP